MQTFAVAAAAAGGVAGWVVALIAVFVLVVGVVAGYFVRFQMAEKKTGSAEETARRIVDDARSQAETMKKEGLTD